MPMPKQVEFKIAEHNVTDVTRETAQVGCTKVSRADVEKLLKQMDAAPKEYDFEIESEESLGSYLNFNIRHRGTGWAAVGETSDAFRHGFGNRSAFFCLERPQAEKLLKFLADQLSTGKKYVVEYQDLTFRGTAWSRSGNVNVKGEFNSFEEASQAAAREEENMGRDYRYRAVPV